MNIGSRRGRGIVRQVKRGIYKEAIKLGEIITGKHSVGIVRISELSLCPDEKVWELMTGTKSVFDPDNILNLGRAIS